MTSKPMSYAALAVAFGLAAGLPLAGQAKELRVAYPDDIPSLDPMVSGAAFPLGAQGWFYETLTGYDKDLKLTPVLAQNWENPEPTKWVFHLRQDVLFHDGSPFTAEDVIFSWQRSLAAASGASPALEAADITKLDDHTIEVTTTAPNPMLPRAWAELHIMSKAWARRHKAASAPKAPGGGSTYASLHENGTGPFVVVDRQPGVQTRLKRYDGYWDARMPTNVTDIVFRPVAQAPARMAALQRGELDLAAPLSIEDWQRAGDSSNNIRVWATHRAQVVFIGMDQHRDELLFSSVTGKNPFKDKRVRQAVSLAIDAGAINQTVMHGLAMPTGTLISRQVNGYDPSFATPYPNDPEKSRKLLADAGYTSGFSIRLDCPSGRYEQDAEICAAIADMLARIGVTVHLPLQKTSGSAALPPAGSHSSMYLMGWTPRYLDAAAALGSLVSCRDGPASGDQYNLGGYCNREIEALTAKINVEIDQIRRNAMIKEAFGILHNDFGYLPLHQPPMLWATRQGVKLHHRPDGVLDVRDVIVEKGDRP